MNASPPPLLEVDALDGRPGVYSSRYAGENVTYRDNNEKLLGELADVPDERRGRSLVLVVESAAPEESVRALRAAGTPVVLLASEAESAVAFEVLAEGADDLLLKPFSGEAVREKLDALGVETRLAG